LLSNNSFLKELQTACDIAIFISYGF